MFQAYLEVIARDSSGKILSLQTQKLTSEAFNSWQELKRQYKATEEQTVQVSVVNASARVSQQNQQKAQTVAGYSTNLNRIYTTLPYSGDRVLDAITIRLRLGVNQPDEKLAHEAGHGFG